MRVIRYAALLGILCLSPALAHATGNVLLPSTNNSPSSPPPPNMGLIPQVEAPAAPKPSATQTKEATPTPAPAPSASLPSPTNKPLSYTPAPPQLPKGGTGIIPTTIIKLDKPPAVSNPAQGSLPENLGVDIPEKYSWGPRDVENLRLRLGFTPEQVSAHCHLAADGTVINEKGVFTFDTDYSPHADLRYDGAISRLDVRLVALCDALPLPPNVGYVVQVNDKYSIPLRQITCPAPPPGAQRAVINYMGNGNGQCEYQ